MNRFLTIFFASVFIFSVSACANLSLNDVYSNPTFAYQSTAIDEVTFSKLAGSSSVIIKNSNPYSIPVTSLGAYLFLEGEPWLALASDAINGLPASDSVAVSFDWNLIYDQLLQRAAAVYESGQAEFTLKLTPTLAVPVMGERTLDWSSKFIVPIPKVPTVRLAGWSLSKVSLTSLEMLLDLEVTNPNAFSINTSDWAMAVNLKGKSIANLKLIDSTMRARRMSTQQVVVSLSILDAGPSVFSALKSGSWPSDFGFNWKGDWSSPELNFDLPSLAGQL